MLERSGRSWTTFWDRANRRVLLLSGPELSNHYWSFVKLDESESLPGVYSVWRAGDEVAVVEVHLDEHDRPFGFPEHLLSDSLLGSQTIWPRPDDAPFMWWTGAGWSEAPLPPQDHILEHYELAFLQNFAGFEGFRALGFNAAELIADGNWTWGYDHGVYCFTRERVIEYVGRALGKTLGERIADRLRSKSDPEWAAVVDDPATRVVVFAVDTDHAFIAAAFEAYLISILKPTGKDLHFNKRLG